MRVSPILGVFSLLIVMGCSGDDDGAADTGPAGHDGGPQLVDGLFPGEPGASLYANVPFVELPDVARDDLQPQPLFGGLPTSDRVLIVTFRREATVGEANAILSSHALRVIGASPLGPVVVQMAQPDAARIWPLSQELAAQAMVLAAAPDVGLSSFTLPAPPSSEMRWTWETRPAGGNFGLEVVRAPQLWNLNDFVRGLGHPLVEVGVQEQSFQPHIDLGDRLTIPGATCMPPYASDDSCQHPLEVTCCIVAREDDGRGVNGISPFAHVTAASTANRTGSTASDVLVALSENFVSGTALALGTSPSRVINISAGYPWALLSPSINPYDSAAHPNIEPLVRQHGMQAADMIANWNDGIRAVLVVSASGNFGGASPALPPRIGGGGSDPDTRANLYSPWNWAALDPSSLSPHFLVVENFGGGGGGSQFSSPGEPIWLPGERRYAGTVSASNPGGHVSAPGRAVLTCARDDGYKVGTGTSLSAPYVVGLASYLLAIEPTLTNAELRVLLRGNTPHNPPMDASRPEIPSVVPAQLTTGLLLGSASIDAFAAALSIDLLRDTRFVQIGLADTDDGTPDGNTRQVRLSEGTPTNGDLQEDARGDRVVDMRDFRRLRDALLLVEGAGDRLDGSATALKRDLNQDDDIDDPATENRYPRFDLNGDGTLHRSERVGFPGIWADRSQGLLTDIEVLGQVFGMSYSGAMREPDTGGWMPADLPSLVDSADVHVHLEGFFADHDEVEEVMIEYRRRGGDLPRDATGRAIDAGATIRVARGAADPHIMTVPAVPGAYLVVSAFDGSGTDRGLADIPARLAPHAGVPRDTQTAGRELDLGDLEAGNDVWVRFGSPPMVNPERIAFIRIDPASPDSSGIVAVLPDGSDERVLTGFAEGRMAGDLACDHAGAFVVFVNIADGGSVNRVRADGTEVELLATSTTGFSAASVSPDDASVALIEDGQVVLLDLATRLSIPLTSGGGGWSSPSWSPDGTTIYISNGSRVFALAASGGVPDPVTPENVRIDIMGFPLDVPVLAFDADAGPLSGRLALVTNYGIISRIPPPMDVSINELYWVDPAMPADFQVITDHSGMGFSKQGPSWSPDERRIAFSGNETGSATTSIYVVDVGGAAATRIGPASGHGSSPCWLRAAM